jgi:hypothetical protein
MPHGNLVCCAAAAIPARETALLHSKVISSAGNDFDMQQRLLLYRK